MATSHRSLLPFTCHTEFSVENKHTYMYQEALGPTKTQEAGGKGQTTMAKLHSNGTTMHACGNNLLANSKSPS